MKKLILIMLSLCFAGCSEKIIESAKKTSSTNAFQANSNCTFSVEDAEQGLLKEATQVEINQKVADQILSELRARGNSKNFWSDISIKSKDELIFDMNMSLSKEKLETSALPYQAVAFYFEELLNTKNSDMAYQVIALKQKSYLFSLKGETINGYLRLRSDCGKKYDDFSMTFLPSNLSELMTIRSLYLCEGKKDQLSIMETHAMTFVKTNDEFIQVDNSSFLVKDSKLFTAVDIATKDISLVIKIIKRLGIKEEKKYRAVVNSYSPENNVNFTGTCSSRFY